MLKRLPILILAVLLSCGLSYGQTPVRATNQIINAQTGTSYAIQSADAGKLITAANGSAESYSIAQSGSAGFPVGWFVDIKNIGAGTVTITPAVSTIDGVAALVLTTGQSARLISSGTNYRTGLTGGGANAVTGPASATAGDLPLLDATGKVLSDSGKAPSTDGTFGSNSDAKMPTEKASKAYADTKQPLNSNLTTIAGLGAPTTDDFLVGVSSLWARRTVAQVKSTLLLNNVDNTSDANKPVSTAQQTALNLKENSANKDASGGYVGLTLFKFNFRNTANTFTSFLINANTASRNYTFQDRNGTIADDIDLAGKVTTGATAISAGLFCSDAGANDTYTCSLSPAIGSYVTGTHYRFKANTANTGAATLNLNSLGAKTIKKAAGGITTDLADNDIQAGQWIDVVYDGTNMQMQSLLGNAPSGGGGANTVTTSVLLSSTTVDLNGGHAKQALYPCPTSRQCVITNIVMQKFSIGGSVALASIGWNANADDVASALPGPPGWPTTTRAFVLNITDAADAYTPMNLNPVIGTAGDILGFVMITAEGAAFTAKVDVYGYLTDTSGIPIANVNGTGDGATIAPSNITGTTTNNNASAGAFGEYAESLIASGSATSLTTATAKNVTSISLTAGDWDVSGNINFAATTATVTGTQGGISSTSATLPTDGSEVFSGVQVTLISENDSVTLPRKRISIASTTTVYLVAKSTFSAGSVSAYGSINARRVR